MSVKVSVCTTTYNHEPFIAEAVQGVMSQETDFSFEHVIGEDCSRDRTREVLLELRTRHPDRMRLLLREENLGGRRNLLSTLGACRGQYVAMLEGDDFWTSPRKLQLQADYLDSHPECAACFHPVMKRFEEEGREKRFAPSPVRDTYTLDDLLERNFIATCSVMFRQGLFGRFPDWIWDLPAADLPLHVLNAQHGDIGYIDEVMAVHRIHSGGVWSYHKASERLQAKIAMLEVLGDHLGPEYELKVRRALTRLQVRMLLAMARDGQLRAMTGYVWRQMGRRSGPKRALSRGVITDIRSKEGQDKQ